MVYHTVMMRPRPGREWLLARFNLHKVWKTAFWESVSSGAAQVVAALDIFLNNQNPSDIIIHSESIYIFAHRN